MKNFFLLLQDAMIVTPIMHYSPRLCFFCLKQEELTDIVNIASWFLNIYNCFTIGPI